MKKVKKILLISAVLGMFLISSGFKVVENVNIDDFNIGGEYKKGDFIQLDKQETLSNLNYLQTVFNNIGYDFNSITFNLLSTQIQSNDGNFEVHGVNLGRNILLTKNDSGIMAHEIGHSIFVEYNLYNAYANEVYRQFPHTNIVNTNNWEYSIVEDFCEEVKVMAYGGGKNTVYPKLNNFENWLKTQIIIGEFNKICEV